MDVYDDYGQLRNVEPDWWMEERLENEAAEAEWLEQQKRERMESLLGGPND